jgi:hypothetical protein
LVFLMTFNLAQVPITVLADASNKTVSSKSSAKGTKELTVRDDGVVLYKGKPLFVGKGDDKIPAKLDALMQKGVYQELTPESDKNKDKSIVTKVLSLTASLFQLDSAKAASTPKIVYRGQVSYGGSIVGVFTVDGEQAFCLEHSKASAPTGTPYEDKINYDNKNIQRALYYGWGGPKNIFGNDRERGIVVTSLVLSRLYTGDYAGGGSINGYDKLWDLAHNGELPNESFKFSDRSLSVSVKGNKQVSQSTTLIADSSNSTTVKVPSGITIVNETTGKKVTNGSMTIKGGQTVHLEADLTVSYDYDTGDLSGSAKFLQPLIVKPKSSRYQVLGLWHWVKDPDKTTSFTAKFVKRTKTITLYHKDKYSSTTLKTETYVKPIGYCYDYAPFNSFTKSGKTYDKENSNHFKGCLGTTNVTHTFYYKLRRSVTVNYYDNRTGEKIKGTKTYTVHQGDKYSETHPTIKKGEYTYRYVKKTGSAESGTVGTSNITINYYYDLPLAKIQLDKLQIYTAKSTEGLPVRVYMSKVENYPESVKDMSTSKITLALYQGSTKLDSKDFTAKSLPNQTTFKITSGLTKNSHKAYTVKLEGYNKNDFAVVSGADKLTTDGYTSNEGTVTFNVNSNISHSDNKSYVVMTEITPKTNMKKYYETMTYSVTPLPKQKTGYGVTTTVTLKYINELGSDYNYATSVPSVGLNFHAPKSLMDSYLDYKKVGSNIEVPMDKSESISLPIGATYQKTFIYHFPHINVEKMTGNLFTDQEVANKDSRIKNTLIDGGHQFYTPIWANLGNYPVDYTSTQIGVNKVILKMTDSINLYAQMLATMDSSTEKLDEILFMPINAEHPFASGKPDNWTNEDVKWLKY